MTSPRRSAHEHLRQQIITGELPAGTKLPSEAALRRQFGVSRTTIREVIRALREQGLIRTVDREGSFVLDRRRIVRDSARRLSAEQRARTGAPFTTDCTEAGLAPTAQVEVAELPADEVIAELLEVPVGTPTLVRSQLNFADGVPVQIAYSHLLREVVPAGNPLELPDCGFGGIYGRLNDLGYDIDWIEDVTARQATDDEALRLRIPPRATVMDILRVTRDADTGGAIEVNRMAMPAARWTNRSRGSAPRPLAE